MVDSIGRFFSRRGHMGECFCNPVSLPDFPGLWTSLSSRARGCWESDTRHKSISKATRKGCDLASYKSHIMTGYCSHGYCSRVIFSYFLLIRSLFLVELCFGFFAILYKGCACNSLESSIQLFSSEP